MRISLRQTAMALAMGAILGGCASNQEAGPESADPGASDNELMVSNHNWSDVTVYAVGRGAPVRLGNVVSMDTRTFDIPTHAITSQGSVQLIADVIGSNRSHQTDRILVTDGDRVEWNLENKLPLSSYTVTSGW